MFFWNLKNVKYVFLNTGYMCVGILFFDCGSYFCLCISAGALWPVKLWLASSICNDYASVEPKSSEHRATYWCQWINGLSLYSAAVPIASVLNLPESNSNLSSDSLPSVFIHCWLYVRKSTNHPMCKELYCCIESAARLEKRRFEEIFLKIYKILYFVKCFWSQETESEWRLGP